MQMDVKGRCSGGGWAQHWLRIELWHESANDSWCGPSEHNHNGWKMQLYEMAVNAW